MFLEADVTLSSGTVQKIYEERREFSEKTTSLISLVSSYFSFIIIIIYGYV